jgi:hypothetical protein
MSGKSIEDRKSGGKKMKNAVDVRGMEKEMSAGT